MKTHWIVKEEPMAGFSLTNIWRQLWYNKFRIHPKYWLRFLYAIVLSLLCLPLRIIDFLRFNRKIRNTKIKTDPVFVIGHYRTGTTFLMSILANDKSKGYISNLEAYLPHIFLAFPKFSKWLLELSMPAQRPMDNMVMGSEEPNEEEYAIGAISKYGYYNGFIFPRNFDRYSKYLTFENCAPIHLRNWKKIYYRFIQRMTCKYDGKMMILKNPANGYRIKHLLEMFPNAKFIHTYRNPYDVYRSTEKFFDEVFAIYTLQTWDKEKMRQDILKNYKALYDKFDEDLNLIPKENLFHLKYETFVQDPIGMLENAYKHLGLPGFEESKPGFQRYIDSQESYKPNERKLNTDIVTRVNEHWDHMREKYGYQKLISY